MALLAALAVAAAVCGPAAASAKNPASAQQEPARTAARTSAPKTAHSLPIRSARPVPGGDEIVVGRGDSDGWHLYAAGSAAPGSWHPLATLDPAQLDPDGQTWIGRQCLTGDGRYVVAVVAPWSANNSAAGTDRGGIAYVVDAHTGATRPLLTGVSLHYFTPSCGAGSQVALTSFVGADEQTTQLITASAQSARVLGVQRLTGEYTSAVPAGDGGIIAVRGRDIVHVQGGKPTTVAKLNGQPFDLTANATGGADFLLGAGRSASVWATGPHAAHEVGTGSFDQLKLYSGRSGHTVAVGVDHLESPSDLIALPRTVSGPEAVSLGGTMTAIAPTAKASQQPDSLLPLRLRTGGRAGAPWTPNAAAPPTASLPPLLTQNGVLIASPSPVGSGGGASAAAKTRKAAQAAATPTFVSDCAVPRNNVRLQAMQPTPEQVDWAANLAGRGLLEGQDARPAGFDNLDLAGYSPSLDFPLPAPFGQGGAGVPREVLEGIFAQESNFNQASWHSVEGVAGNPLIADYYGAGGGYVAGVQTPDCGYGLGQITTGMHTGDLSYDLQRKVAVDYAEDAAAATQILAEKWSELAGDGIDAGDGNPSTLESWYFAIWDYNSGLEPGGAYGNTSGCTPGPSCTGPDGTWGLGWRNNPANPAYPYNRHPFLHEDPGTGDCTVVPCMTYGDAATPGDWPYQEKVFGWMQVPLRDPSTGQPAYAGTMWSLDPLTDTDALNTPWAELNQPGVNAFCDMSADHCDPTADPGTCELADSYCWWHSADLWCADDCTTGTWEYGQGTAEPPNGNANIDPIEVCSVDTSVVPAGSSIVDTQPTDENLQGCDASGADWHSSGSFGFSYGDPNDPGAQATDMDLHQLGAGLGGHMFFTHTDEPTDSNGESLWGVTGTWSPNLAKGRYRVEVFVPNAGATATEADYTVDDGLGLRHTVTINQNASDGWVGLGDYWLGPGSDVSLTNLGVTSPGDLAYSAVAFVPQPVGNYVMLGDSYSSGEGALNYDSDTANFKTTCGATPCTNNGHRSPLSYNRVFAAGTTSFGSTTNPNWTDVACSGAVIADFYTKNANGNCPNEPGQVGALNSDTSLVTMTFGGNDLGFAPVVKACVLELFAGDCKSKYDAQIRADVQQLADPNYGGGWPELFATIHSKAPNAEVVILGYPHLVTGNDVCLGNGFIPDQDQQWLNEMGDLVDSTLAQVARQNGVDYVSTASTFAGHELCSGSSYFTGIPDPITNDTKSGEETFVQNSSGLSMQEWFHPNPYGYAAEAALLRQVLQIP